MSPDHMCDSLKESLVVDEKRKIYCFKCEYEKIGLVQKEIHTFVVLRCTKKHLNLHNQISILRLLLRAIIDIFEMKCL